MREISFPIKMFGQVQGISAPASKLRHIPVSVLGSIALLTWIFGGETLFTGDPLLAVLTGGAILGAFYMATDMVTTPVSARGMLIFGVGCGVLTVLIRLFGGYPEGVSFAILLMNAATPLIDRYTKPRTFGTSRRGGGR